MKNNRIISVLACALPVLLLSPSLARGQDPLEQAIKAAAAKVAPSLVQIQTVGGLEMIGGGRGAQMVRGQGPTTGVAVSTDGYILSSTFNFAHKPSGITVSLPGSKEPLAAKVVATDHTRMLTLLKVEASGLPVPEAAPKQAVKIGQWAITLGKTWSLGADGPPSVSVGIISALDRIWGKAVQTDAKVSPVNYGGPLVDLQGRVIGILVPLSPSADGETAGVEWYDSGIGFAVPLEDINRVLPWLKEGRDLHRGYLGISPRDADTYSAKPVIGNVARDSAGDKAGIKTGDAIVEIDGVKVARQAQIMHVLGNKYEGDRVSLKIDRDGLIIDLPNLELAGLPTSHLQAFLGILPMRDDPEPGLEVRYIYPKSPASEAGLMAGDRILKIEERPVAGRDGLLQRLAQLSPGNEVKLEVARKADMKTETLKIKLGELPDAVPDELPPGSHKKALAPRKPVPGRVPGKPQVVPAKPPGEPKKDEKPPEEKKDARVGFYTKTDPTTGREYWVYVPEDYDPNVSHALVVWLHPAGDPMEASILRIWQELCKKHHIILLGPKAENPTGWLTSEADSIKADIRELLGTYTIDRQRVVVHGLGHGANLAFFLGFDARDLVRGVAAVGGLLPGQAKENLAHQRLVFFLVAGAKDPAIEAVRATKPKLIEKKFPVRYHELPDQGNGYITDADLLRELARWIDALDRL